MTRANGPIRFRTLGTIDLRGGVPGDMARLLGQDKRIALLTYLALQPAPLRREVLLAMFWPDSTERNGRAALRQALHYLRKSLREDVLDSRGTHELRVDPRHLRCDARDLSEAYEARDWARAARLYRGEFLRGFHVERVSPDFEFWVEKTRNRLWGQARAATGRLVEEAEGAGDLERAVRWARKAHDLDPLDEPMLELYLRLLVESDEPTRARQVYELYRRRLTEELGSVPGQAVERVIEPARREADSATLDRTSRGLPSRISSFVGRESEVRNVRAILAAPRTRLLTLTGPGGVGKTRLAIEVARRTADRFPGGVHFVPLAALQEAAHVPDALAREMGFARGSSEEVTAEVARHDADGERRLLLMDNLEHLLEAAPFVGTLLAHTRGLTILATSREPLRLEQEREYVVPPLSLPARGRPLSAGDLPLDSEAVALFLARARRVDSGFQITTANVVAIGALCRRLDGLPLAIELAAARMRSLTPEALAARLPDDVGVLGPGPRDRSDRQRTLEKTIQWSVDLLDPAEKRLLALLSVFAGDIPLEAAEALWEDEGRSLVPLLASLVEKSLLQRATDVAGEPRYEMLRTVRSFAARMDIDPEERTRWLRQHAEHFADWLTEGHRLFCTDSEAGWHRQIELEHENVRAALRWAETAGETVVAGRILNGVGYFWFVRGHFHEGLEWTRRVLSRDDELPSDLHVRLLANAAGLAMGCGEVDEAVDYLRRGVDLCRANGDRPGLARSLINLGFAFEERHEIERGIAALEEALSIAREDGDQRRVAVALCGLGDLLRIRGDFQAARESLEESRLLAEMVGDHGRAAQALTHLGETFEAQDRLAEAEDAFRRALDGFEDLGHRVDVAFVLLWLGEIERRKGRPGPFRAATMDALHVLSEVDYRPGIGHALAQAARIAAEQGDPTEGVRILAGVETALGSEALLSNPFHSRALAALRPTLDPTEFERAWRIGTQLTLDHLVSRTSELTPAVELRVVP